MGSYASSTDGFCGFGFFDCFGRNAKEPRRVIPSPARSLRREKEVHYQQPHLVEPMKLRVYEDLPSTPITPQHNVGAWTLFPRSLNASRASIRSSMFSLRKHAPKQDVPISKPTPIALSCNDLPLRRRQEYRPLELSIYVDENRLSDLPEFNRFSFTEDGILKTPVRALARPQSEQIVVLRERLATPPEMQKPASMYEAGGVCFVRPGTSYSVISSSRPPSEYDALNSHPVSWVGLPGLSISTKSLRVDNNVAILTPMEEEFPHEDVAVAVGDTILSFPNHDPTTNVFDAQMVLETAEMAALAPIVPRMQSREENQSAEAGDQLSRLSSYINPRTNRRISQWLAYRQQSASTSTIGSTSTGSSFAEHRRKRSQFYQLTKQNLADRTPQPLDLTRGQSPSQPFHSRTVTLESMASTVDTDILSYDMNSNRKSQDTMTTLSVGDVLSRCGTIKVEGPPHTYKLMPAELKGLLPQHPALRGDVHIVDDESPYLDAFAKETGTQSVGLAF